MPVGLRQIAIACNPQSHEVSGWGFVPVTRSPRNLLSVSWFSSTIVSALGFVTFIFA